MKKTLILTGILLSALIIISCKCSKPRDHYSGFVADESSVPISDNDSIEMRHNGRLVHTQYLNRGIGEIIYRYYDHGTIEREVYNIGMDTRQIHFRDYKYVPDSIQSIGYLSSSDSIPSLLKGDWGEYWRIGVIKAVQGKELLSEKYILWRSSEDCIQGRNDQYIGEKTYYNNDNSYMIEKYAGDSIINWLYYPNGQLNSHWVNKALYGGMFSTFSISYDSLGYKTEEINWNHSYPESGTSYNETFSVTTTRKYYRNGKLKSLTKTESFCEGDSYRCGKWIYYNEQGKILKTENYGNCNSFEIEEKYNEANFSEDGK